MVTPSMSTNIEALEEQARILFNEIEDTKPRVHMLEHELNVRQLAIEAFRHGTSARLVSLRSLEEIERDLLEYRDKEYLYRQLCEQIDAAKAQDRESKKKNKQA